MLRTDAEPIQQLMHQGGISLSTLCAAIAVAQALDISTDLIRAGLKSFSQKSAILPTSSKGSGQ
jgi:UDP-N-acetylmuramyl pentapeptide synthase